MHANRIFNSAFNGIRSKCQTMNSKIPLSTPSNVSPYSSIANETNGKTSNILMSNPVYSKMLKNTYNTFEVHQGRFIRSNGGGMFAQKEAASEEQWIYNRDRELLNIIKKKMAAKDAMAISHSDSISTSTMKALNFNPAFNKGAVRFQIKQSPIGRFHKSRINEEAEILKNNSSFYRNQKPKSGYRFKNTKSKENNLKISQDQERLEKLKKKFAQRK